MRVLAIGATGFIGLPVVSQLVEQGHDVAILHRGKTTARMPNDARHISGDRDKLHESRADIESFAPDVVLDAILYTEQQARELVEVCRGRTSRIVALSSADVYRNYDGLRSVGADAPDPAPLTEDSPLRRTRYPYRGADVDFKYARDYDKILVEQVLLNTELPSTLLRLPAVYGPGDSQHRLRPYLKQMMDGRPSIQMEQEQADWRWTRAFVVNAAAAIACAVTDARSAGSIYNVGEEPALTERQWVEAIGYAAGWKGEVIIPRETVPGVPNQSLDWRYSLWTDTRRIRRELGYAEPVPLTEALERTIEWERSALSLMLRAT